MTTNNFKVCIRCSTFNHKGYIQDAMNGFAMQRTDFPYVAVIIDDCSTDGAQEVIKGFLAEHFILDDPTTTRLEETEDYSMTFARHKENTNCFFAVYLLKYNHYSIKKSKEEYIREWTSTPPYISLCEGDDFWTDAGKLQTQINFLDQHKDFTMCFHKVTTKVEGNRDKSESNKFEFLIEREYTKKDQLKMMRIVPTCSITIRAEIFNNMPKNPKFTIGDLVVVATALSYGRIYCHEKNMGVYRLVDCGWTAMSDFNICKSMFSHYQGMIESFDWYQCKDGYNSFKFWAFSYMQQLKDATWDSNHEFQKATAMYKSFMGVNNLSAFYRFYITRKYRKLIRTVLGKKVTDKLRSMMQDIKRYSIHSLSR